LPASPRSAPAASAGALLRWLLSASLNALWPSVPLGTLIANLSGGYLIGLAFAWISANPALPPELRLLVVTGFLGGLTTFSTFSVEVVGRRPARQPVLGGGDRRAAPSPARSPARWPASPPTSG